MNYDDNQSLKIIAYYELMIKLHQITKVRSKNHPRCRSQITKVPQNMRCSKPVHTLVLTIPSGEFPVLQKPHICHTIYAITTMNNLGPSYWWL